MIRIHRASARSGDLLERALGPEATREVPRSRATLARPDPRTIALEVFADDTGALRAALNAYLGWIRLALEAEGVAGRASGGRAPASEGQ